VWKHLKHPNIVPLFGITPVPLQLVSEWIPGGDLSEYIKNHPGADRLGFVGAPPIAFDPALTPAASYLMSPMGFTTYTPAT